MACGAYRQPLYLGFLHEFGALSCCNRLSIPQGAARVFVLAQLQLRGLPGQTHTYHMSR